jgi:hypothetical protein
MRKLLATAFLSFSLLACKPPVTELQIPLVSSMQGKGYQEILLTTEFKASAASETITAYVITPEMSMINIEEKFRAEGKADQIEKYRTKTIGDDTIICQVRLLAVSKDNAESKAWTYTITDDTGKSTPGKVVGEVRAPQKVAGSSGGFNFIQDAQIVFEGYKIGAAKKLSIAFTRPGGKPTTTLTWVLPADHKAQIPVPTSQPAASSPVK